MLNLQASSVLSPTINTFLAEVSAQYLINPLNTPLVQKLGIFKPRGLVSLTKDSYRSGARTCYYVSTYRESPGFVEEDKRASGCGTPPQLLSFAQDKCTSIGNKFKYYNLGINRSLVDGNTCIAGQSAMFNYLANLMFRLPALLSDLNRIAIEAFFEGLFSEYRVNSGVNGTVEVKNWFDISSLPNAAIPQLPTTGISVKHTMNLASILQGNKAFSSNLGNYVMFVGPQEFEKFMSSIIDKNYTCCNIALGNYSLDDNALRSYRDPMSNLRIVQVPDYLLRYDPGTKRVIYPVVNLNNYFVTAGPSLTEGLSDIASVGTANCERSVINIGDYSVYYRAANGLITHTDGAWETFETCFGAVRNNIRDVAFFVLGSDVDTDQGYAARFVEPSGATPIPSGNITVLS